MNYYSLNRKAPNTTFKDAVIKGLAPDKGLYFPESITPLPKSFFEGIDDLSHSEIAFEAIKQCVEPDMPEKILKSIFDYTVSIDFRYNCKVGGNVSFCGNYPFVKRYHPSVCNVEIV